MPRYPAFWDSMIFCGRPDMDHGGAAMVQLQEMLLQTPGDKLHLFPAWPAEWDVDFKLHAPRQTMVEGVAARRQTRLAQSHARIPRQGRGQLARQGSGGCTPVDLERPQADHRQQHLAGTGYEAAKANDNDLMTRWASDDDARDGTLTIDLGAEHTIARVWLAETDFANTREFSIEVQQGEHGRKSPAAPPSAPTSRSNSRPSRRAIRLRIIKADGPINLNEFQVFFASSDAQANDGPVFQIDAGFHS